MDVNGRKTVLIVDDEELNIDVMSVYLEDDFEIQRAFDGESALEQLASPPFPDAILLDVNMPGIDGYEVCTRIRAEPRTAQIPVLFVTALEQDEALCFEVGASEYISKPITREVLRARLMIQLELQEKRSEVARLQRALENAEVVRAHLERRQKKLMDLTTTRGAELRELRERLRAD